MAAVNKTTETRTSSEDVYRKVLIEAFDSDVTAKEVFEWYQHAADMGDSDAMYKLGLCYECGFGVVKNMSKAFVYYKRASYLNNEDALSRLAADPEQQTQNEQYVVEEEHQEQPQEDTLDAVTDTTIITLSPSYSTSTSANSTVSPSKKEMAETTSDINGLYRLTQSFESLEHAANMGDAECMAKLGVCYEKGLGTTRDIQKAHDLYQRSCLLGNAYGIFRLGMCYEKGNGTTKDVQKAVCLYRRAVLLDCSDAICRLGHCYKKE